MARIESPDLSSPGFKADPYPFYARLRAEAPVYRTRLSFWLSAWLVTRYDDIVFVLKEGPFSRPERFLAAGGDFGKGAESPRRLELGR